MKALLVAMNAKYIHSNLGIYSIRAYGLAHGIPEEQLRMAEYTINQNREEVLADIYRHQPDFIAFSCYIWNIQQIKELAAELNKILPQVPIWLGGPEVSFDAEQLVADDSWVTGVMVGEGEETFREVFQAYSQNIDEPELTSVAGLVYRDFDGELVITAEREKLPMDKLVFPYQNMEGLEHRIVYYETSRGCPYGCSYCLSSVEKKVRFRSIELVEKELQFFLDRKVPQVKFVDRTFNCRHEHTMAIWKYIYEHDNGVTNFHFELSADLLTEDEIEYVSKFRPGLVQFEIGVQSTNPCTIEAIHRKTSLDVLRDKVARVHQSRNIHQHLDLIAGLPWEDYTSFQKSFNEVYAMKPDQLQLGFLKVLKGSPIYCQREEFGIVYQDTPPYEVLFTRWLSYEDVLRLKQVEDMVERYYNSMQFEAALPFVAEQFGEPFDFFQSLGKYYQEEGFNGLHQSRLQNYEILLDFCRENTRCDEKILRQLMMYDLYARENLKARPDFLECPVGKEQKDWNRQFYQEDDRRLHYLPEYSSYDWKQTARMTHLEHFTFSVPEYLATGEIKEEKCILLFDYHQRNPLSHQARICRVG
ncbi:MAG: B12-binding domain-containing radical SAM protein [Lachnospiraceae bacterium]|nr:B12-binding domain-containing radical SAM protein [Lachnospiraceae bacterium]